jgi:hypothetical protein
MCLKECRHVADGKIGAEMPVEIAALRHLEEKEGRTEGRTEEGKE